MKPEVGNVAQLLCKYRLLSFRYNREIKVVIYISKVLGSQKCILHETLKSSILGKVTLKMQQLYQRSLHGVHIE